MKIDLEHLHYWMCAIRESKDPLRTLDAFWQGQMKSKEWLIENLEYYIHSEVSKTSNLPLSVDIHGGWVGVLASMLFQSNIPISNIRSIDIDSGCQLVAVMMNKKEEIEGRFRAITADMCETHSDADVIINTSCEHITQDKYDIWLDGHSCNSLLVLQSNNYSIPEHIRIANSLDDFIQQSNIKVFWAGELNLPLYKRFMIIGKKDV
jgi:hypothetical protein